MQAWWPAEAALFKKVGRVKSQSNQVQAQNRARNAGVTPITSPAERLCDHVRVETKGDAMGQFRKTIIATRILLLPANISRHTCRGRDL